MCLSLPCDPIAPLAGRLGQRHTARVAYRDSDGTVIIHDTPASACHDALIGMGLRVREQIRGGRCIIGRACGSEYAPSHSL